MWKINCERGKKLKIKHLAPTLRVGGGELYDPTWNIFLVKINESFLMCKNTNKKHESQGNPGKLSNVYIHKNK